jgi:phage terminase small subunit
MPSSLRMLKGNPGRRPMTKTEPAVPPGIPEPPEFLTDVALQEWRRVAPELAAAGLLTELDRAALSMYCTPSSGTVARSGYQAGG